jgi:hypothetical protein
MVQGFVITSSQFTEDGAMRKTSYVIFLFLAISLSVKGEGNSAATANDLRNEFELSYKAWKQYCEKLSSSSIEDYLNSDYYRKIIKMGPAVLPLLAEKCIQDKDFPLAGWPWTVLAKIVPDPKVNPWANDLVKTWWEGGRELARERFLSQYDEFRKAKEQGRAQDVEKYRKAIRSMGILAVGAMMEQLDTDDDILPMISYAIGDELGDSKKDKQAIHSWWTANKQIYELPTAKR